MHYKEQHTDKELLESGWSQMQGRLDNEMPTDRQYDKWYFLAIALLLLTASVSHLCHSHKVELNIIASNTNEQSNKDFQSAKTDNLLSGQTEMLQVEEIQQEHNNEEIEEPQISTQITAPGSTSSTQVNAKPHKVKKDGLINSESHTKEIAEARAAIFQSNRSETNIIQHDGDRGAKINIKNQPSSEVKVEVNNPSKLRSLLSIGTTIPLLNQTYIEGKIDRSLPNATESELRYRKVTPFISIGILRNFHVDKIGINMGFGLNHQIQSRPKLSMRYLLSTSFLPNRVVIFSRDNNALADEESIFVDTTEGGQEDVPPGTNSQVEQEPINITYYQLTASVIGYYRLHHRISIGLGGTLAYQDVKTSLRADALQMQENVLDTYSQFGGVAYFSTPLHLTPRLSLEPYYQYQLTGGDIKANQAGLNLTFSLSR